MRYLLDTNACSLHLNRRNARLSARLAATPPDELATCSVVRAELTFGLVKGGATDAARSRLDTFLGALPSLPFDDRAADVYAAIRAELESAGMPIGANDLLIASIAVANGLTVVTHNSAEFERVPGLSVEDWEA